MKRSRDLLWLVVVLAVVGLAVAYTPYEIPIQRVNPVVRTSPLGGPSVVVTPDVFTTLCRGSSHAKAYTGYQDQNMPQYCAEAGLIDHP